MSLVRTLAATAICATAVVVGGTGTAAADVDVELPVGDYRLCTMVSSFAGDVNLGVGRGGNDDCVRFTLL
jgi:hypothetical protein